MTWYLPPTSTKLQILVEILLAVACNMLECNMLTAIYFLSTNTFHGPATQTLVPEATSRKMHLQLACADEFGELVVLDVRNVLLHSLLWGGLGRSIIALRLSMVGETWPNRIL